MQPQGRKPVRFPSKTDCHPPPGHVNWWEAHMDTSNKKADRQTGRREAEAGVVEMLDNMWASEMEPSHLYPDIPRDTDE